MPSSTDNPTPRRKRMMTLIEVAESLGVSRERALTWLSEQGVPRYDLNAGQGPGGTGKKSRSQIRVRHRDFVKALRQCQVATSQPSQAPHKRPPTYVPRHFEPTGQLRSARSLRKPPSRRGSGPTADG